MGIEKTFLLGRTSDGPPSRVRAWAGKSFPLELSNIFPMFQDHIHPESPIGIGVAMEAAPVAWSVFFAPLQGGRHGAGHGWCTAACCSRRLAFGLILLQQRSVNNQWYENSAQGFLSRKCERAAFCCWGCWGCHFFWTKISHQPSKVYISDACGGL